MAKNYFKDLLPVLELKNQHHLSKSDSAAKHDIETLQHVAEQKEKTEDGVQH